MLTDREKKLIKVIVETAKQFPHQQASQRLGQALMNALWETDPGFYNHISGTGADCFNLDCKIEDFCEAVIIEM